MSIGSVSGIGSGWEQMQRQAMQQTMFKQMDQNGDGSITKSDLQALAQNISQTTGASINVDQVMSTLDTNKDGTIDQSEYDSAMQQFQSGGQQGQIHGHHHHHHHGAQQAGGSDGSADPLMALFQQMDQDGDGKVSQSEFQTGLQNLTQGSGDATGLGNLFAMLDTNGDGVIDQAEQAAAPQALANAGQSPPMPPPVQGSADLLQALFQQLDQNGDGEISQTEFQTGLQNLAQNTGGATGQRPIQHPGGVCNRHSGEQHREVNPEASPGLYRHAAERRVSPKPELAGSERPADLCLTPPVPRL